MKIATACYPVGSPRGWSEWEDKVTHWVEEARADLLVFPEYGAMELAAMTGARGLQAEMAAVSDALPRAWEVWGQLAQSHAVHILAPSGPVLTKAGPVNRAMFFAPSGASQAHDKQVMTPWERAPMGCVPGAPPVLMQTTLGRIGVQVCYDGEFPLATRAMAEAGLDILLVPSQTETVHGYNRVRIGAQARALEAQCFSVQSPTQGRSEWSEVVDVNAGAAGIFAPPDTGFPPDGVLAMGAMDTPGWTRADADLERLRAARAGGGVRGRADWPTQFGATACALPPVELVDLT
ncbi:amidohydrolase [Maritimibacter sp. DP07]|uniref:Amidohydrolase n=1 Tax=Maritimibacter harenae TaxID=2606218 RepID=A0A845MBD4_9RHOB|nr:carbon-nitrogen hydrolase family protein [Maritimibacter harenae]MZR15054.1 amidohydrolase [Maritimibacter harenae]